ncbi:MAG: NAD-binding protein [Spirochaetales bacterium]|nr:NAD-binding protein [Spirochaetales bacterium]
MANEKIMIIGLGQFGMSLPESLLREGLSGDLLVIDRNEERIRLIRDRVQNAIILDVTNGKQYLLIFYNPQDNDRYIYKIYR